MPSGTASIFSTTNRRRFQNPAVFCGFAAVECATVRKLGQRRPRMAFGNRPAGCPPGVDALEWSGCAWPAAEPFPLSAEEALWLLRGYAVLPASGPMDVD